MEGFYMSRFQEYKDLTLAPILHLLSRLKVSPTAISASSAFIATAGLIVSIAANNPFFFIFSIWLHAILDGIDGPLARLTKQATTRGALVDVIADYVGIIAACIYMATFTTTTALNAYLLATLYAAVLIIALLRSYNGYPYALLIRPRFILYAAIVIDAVWLTNLTAPTVAIGIGLLIVSCLSGALSFLQHRLKFLQKG